MHIYIYIQIPYPCSQVCIAWNKWSDHLLETAYHVTNRASIFQLPHGASLWAFFHRPKEFRVPYHARECQHVLSSFSLSIREVLWNWGHKETLLKRSKHAWEAIIILELDIRMKQIAGIETHNVGWSHCRRNTRPPHKTSPWHRAELKDNQ